ncbi:hypothetical protein [Aquimarina brevivitae]|uniref:Lipoprotein n=1 Tax=Aquimarina brevivitae TaxID=323412 RepID=A0A4Q7PFK0_9FLAO|nr:hypothetical protein [Aquimarina brevivitae]RZS98957.1 hypothetical protein EV197_0159 [Aquimarina brevivitae]
MKNLLLAIMFLFSCSAIAHTDNASTLSTKEEGFHQDVLYLSFVSVHWGMVLLPESRTNTVFIFLKNRIKKRNGSCQHFFSFLNHVNDKQTSSNLFTGFSNESPIFLHSIEKDEEEPEKEPYQFYISLDIAPQNKLHKHWDLANFNKIYIKPTDKVPRIG